MSRSRPMTQSRFKCMKTNYLFAFLCGAVVRLLCIFALPAATVSGQALKTSIEARSAKIGAVQLPYLTAGEGPAVLLIHGYAETSRMWRPIIPMLAQKVTVIAPDL